MRNNRFTRFLARRLHPILEWYTRRRIPSLVIPRLDGTPYLYRWHMIPRNPLLNLYLHEYWADDEDRALHDHPWWSASLMLTGSLIEVYQGELAMIGPYGDRQVTPVERTRVIREGTLVTRSSTFAHRLIVPDKGSMTLFFTGPRIRTWGFLCGKGWMHYKEFTAKDASGRARGCGEMAA